MKKTRRSFIFAIISLVLCFAMITSTTYAWFTDNQTVKNNKIKAGTLDVDLLMDQMTNGSYSGTYTSIANNTAPVFNYDKWEPGYSDAKKFKVVNKGNLALKYTLDFAISESLTGIENENIDNGSNTDLYRHLVEKNANSHLENILRVVVSGTDVGTLKDVMNDNSILMQGRSSILLPNSSTDFGEIKIVMPTTGTNEYQNASILFDIRLVATQYTYEYDGFGSNQYDSSSDLWKINDQGTWYGIEHTDIMLKNTDRTYITVLQPNGQPSEIIVLETNGTFKVGNGTAVVSGSDISYVNTAGAQEVVIRTEGQALTVNAPNDKVSHYGNSSSIDIISVAKKSYHEYGFVPFLEISKGRIVLEQNAQVSMIYFDTKVTNVSANGVKTKTANVFDEIILNVESGAKLPDFLRDSVSEIPSTGTLVVEVEKANNVSDYIYLYQFGLVQEIKVTSGTQSNISNQKVAFSASAPNGDSTTLDEDTRDIAEDIANNLKSGLTTATSLNDVEGGLSTQAEIDAKKENVIRKNELAVYDPNNQFVENLSLAEFRSKVNSKAIDSSSAAQYVGYTIKVLQDCDYSNANWTPIGVFSSSYFEGIFDGQNHTITIKNDNCPEDDMGLFDIITGEDDDPAAVKNLTVEANFITPAGRQSWVGVVCAGTCGNVLFDNVTSKGFIQAGATAGGIIGWGANAFKYQDGIINKTVLNNCVNEATIKILANSKGWYLMGGIAAQTGEGTVEFNECVNNGKLTCDFTTDPNAYVYAGHMAAKGEYDSKYHIYINDCSIGQNASLEGYGIYKTTGENNFYQGFEGFDLESNSYTYTGSPNFKKQCIGAYFGTCHFKDDPTAYTVEFPHGNS